LLILQKKDFEDADINKAIRDTATISRNVWKYVAELKLELDEELVPVKCSIDDLNQVFLNMVVNAADAIREKEEKNKTAGNSSESSRGLITIRTKRCERGVVIEFEDTGVGIPAAIVDRIYDPFFTTKDVGVGTGQGLAISHTIVVAKHKGTIAVETKEGIGTKFIITIPVH